MKLTLKEVDAAPLAARGMTRKLSDGDGLFLLITSAAKGWRFRFTRDGKDAMMSLGVYPDITLPEARRRAKEQRDLLAFGEDPQAVRQVENAARLRQKVPFSAVARKYNNAMATRVALGQQSPKTLARCERMFRFASAIHDMSFQQIKRRDLLALCKAVAKSGKRESAHRLGIWLRTVWLYAIDEEYVEPGHNPTAAGFSRSLTRDGLGANEVVSRPALTTPKEVGALMRVVDSSEWLLEAGVGPVGVNVSRALQLLARTVVRPGELANAEWVEFQLDGKDPVWVLPLGRMKMQDASRTDHIVPLSRQAAHILKAQRKLTGHGVYVFPHHRTDDRPMTSAAMPAAMLSLGYRDQHCPHGFRSTFSTLARESLKAESEIVERQLAHKVGSEVQGAYDRSQRLSERRKLMQDYSDLLDQLRDERSSS